MKSLDKNPKDLYLLRMKILMVSKFDKKDLEDCPSMEEMFKIGDKIKQKRKYSTQEILKMIDDFRNEELHLVKR